jgi:threonine synthase
MRYHSTKDQSHHVGFREAVRRGLAPDGGLYFPEHIPLLDSDFFTQLPGLTLPEIGYAVMRHFTSGEIDRDVLQDALHRALNFHVPLVHVGDGIFSLELFHGPTLAFKDVGARFMGQILPYCMPDETRITVLVATSGDTGSAVAHGFYEVPGVRVVILYPQDKVSRLQELQMTTLGKNIHAIAVAGTFDDCQALVKGAFLDGDLSEKLYLTSANSINIARWLPQSLYYFLAVAANGPAVMAIPSGNLGNFTAGILAMQMGLDIRHCIATCNANDVIFKYVLNGDFTPRPSVKTVANAMDVGDPSNFARLLALFQGQHNRIREVVSSVTYSDIEILTTIRECYDETGYVLDPHGATAYRALRETQRGGIFLATAHPAKFGEIYDQLGIGLQAPEALLKLNSRHASSTTLSKTIGALKEYLLGLN